jgi:uncharacterized lipoprotein YmbA
MIKTGVLLVLSFALASALGCASKVPPERAYYFLRSAPHEFSTLATGQSDAGRGIGLGKVEVPPYLDRMGLVVEVGTNEVREARYHLWAEPLHRGIHYYLEDRIAADLGQPLAAAPPSKGGWRYRIDVRVREFHGTVDGAARLVASFTLTAVASGELLAEEQVSFAEQQPAEGYPGLVQAQISLLDRLSTSIATALREVAAPPG